MKNKVSKDIDITPTSDSNNSYSSGNNVVLHKIPLSIIRLEVYQTLELNMVGIFILVK